MQVKCPVCGRKSHYKFVTIFVNGNEDIPLIPHLINKEVALMDGKIVHGSGRFNVIMDSCLIVEIASREILRNLTVRDLHAKIKFAFKKFILKSVIIFRNMEHFTTLILEPEGTINELDCLDKNIKSFNPENAIIPLVLFYVRKEKPVQSGHSN